MKIKTIMMLVALAVLFGALAYHSVQNKKLFSSPATIGSKVLANLPVNRVGKIIITSRDGVATIAKSNDKWVVASRFNYPANFDKVADTIRALSELKVGQTVNVDPSQLGAFNLLLASAAGTNKQAGAGTLLELRDEKDGFLASLLVGKGFMRQPAAPSSENMMGMGGFADGQYVKSVDGKVYLVAKSLERMTEGAKTWLADNFIDAPSSDIKEISVSGPDRAPIKLVAEAPAASVPLAAAPAAREGGSFTLADLRPEEGTMENTKINQMANSLNRLGFDDIADPALTLKETGLDRPVIFKATTKDGLIYTLQLGNTLTNDTFDRYVTISVTNAPAADQPPSDKPKEDAAGKEAEKAPEKKNISGQAAALNSSFAPWIYIIKSYRAEPILFNRADLIKKPEPPKKEDTAPKPSAKGQESEVKNP